MGRPRRQHPPAPLGEFPVASMLCTLQLPHAISASIYFISASTPRFCCSKASVMPRPPQLWFAVDPVSRFAVS